MNISNHLYASECCLCMLNRSSNTSFHFSFNSVERKTKCKNKIWNMMHLAIMFILWVDTGRSQHTKLTSCPKKRVLKLARYHRGMVKGLCVASVYLWSHINSIQFFSFEKHYSTKIHRIPRYIIVTIYWKM